MKFLFGFLPVFASLFFAGLTCAQSVEPDDSDVQAWHDAKISKKLTSKLDLVIPVSARFGNQSGAVTEARVGIGFSLKLPHRMSLAPSYQFIKSRSASGRYNTEHRYSLSAGISFPLGSFGLAHKSTFELRDRSSRESVRYRPSITVDHALPERWIKDAKFFVTEEVFFDSVTDDLSRNRLTVGIQKQVSPKNAIDIFYLRQDDRHAAIGTIHAIGTSWKIKL